MLLARELISHWNSQITFLSNQHLVFFCIKYSLFYLTSPSFKINFYVYLIESTISLFIYLFCLFLDVIIISYFIHLFWFTIILLSLFFHLLFENNFSWILLLYYFWRVFLFSVPIVISAKYFPKFSRRAGIYL